jgi:hypothetical protein
VGIGRGHAGAEGAGRVLRVAASGAGMHPRGRPMGHVTGWATLENVVRRRFYQFLR